MVDQVLRTGLTLVGAYFFGPIGALVGGFIGDLLFPQDPGKGPRINELNVQHSTVGAAIPLVYGTAALAGNIIWSGGLQETEHEGESGGKKGGGSAPSNFTYAVDVAIGICEGPISGIRRIWADADLIFDASDDTTLEERLVSGGGFGGNLADTINAIRAMSAQLDFTLYTGTEDQMPDPTIESYEVAGTTPAYRGLAYIVFQQFQLANYGNRIPNFRFEVTTAGTPTECGIYSVGHLEPWAYMLNGGVHDPRNPANNHLYSQSAETTTFAQYPFATAMADMNATLPGWATGDPSFVCGETPQVGDSQYIRGWAASSTPNYSQPCDADDASAPDLSVDRVRVTMNLNTIRKDALSCNENTTGSHCLDLWTELGEEKYAEKWFNAGDASGFYVMTDDNVNPYDGGSEGAAWDPRGDCTVPTVGVLNMWAAFDSEMSVRRWHAPDACIGGTPIPGAPGYCVVNGVVVGGVTWTRVSGTFKSLRPYIDTGEGGVVTSYPVDPCLATTDTNYNDQAFWEAAYAEALADPTIWPPMDPTWVYGVDYPTARFSHASNFSANTPVWYSECETIDTACVPMSIIVADLCRRAGLRTDTSSQIDVSDLTTCVTGYIVGSQMSARDALGPLRQFGLWDCCESDGLLKFVERGHPIVATLTSEDLGAHEFSQQAPTLVETSRLQEKDLPRRLRVHFPNYEHDHEASEQSWSRITTEATNELDVNLPITMTPDTAIQLAEILLYSEWVGRNTFRLALDNDFLRLEPSDCIEVPVDGQTERMRIISTNYSIGGILQIECQRDDDGAYQSTAVATPGQPSGGAPGSGGNGPLCPSGIVLLDIPRLLSTHIDAGYYAAIYGLCDSWKCAELYRSNDGGLTYTRVGRTDIETTVGEITDISGPATDPTLPGESPAYDAFNTITVSLFEGELASITDEQIADGQNLAAVGLDGRWVIIQFKTATLSTASTWVLSDLIWGVNDTQHLLGTTVDGDTFVLLSDNGLLRIPEAPEAIGVEKDFKVLTCGQALDDVTSFPFTTWGLSYQQLCPSTVISATTTTPPALPTDGDSYLLPNDTSLSGVWATHGGEIATWNDDTGTWAYCTPIPGTIIHISEGEATDGTGGDDVIVGGGGTTTPAPWQRSIEWFDEGVSLGAAGSITEVDFTGPGILATVDSSGRLNVEVTATGTGDTGGPAVAPIDWQDEGVDVGGDVLTVNFTGLGVTATLDSSGVLEVAIPAAGALSINTQTGNYTAVLGDANTVIYRDSGSAATWTIPSNASVAYPVGTMLTWINLSTTDISLAITSNTNTYVPGGATGTRRLIPGGMANSIKVTTTSWVTSGVGVF